MLFQKLSGYIPDTQETFRKLTERLETLFGNPQATFQTLRKCSRNSLGHWKHPLETLSQLLDTLRLLKYLLDALSEILKQLPRHSGNLLKTLWTHSGNSPNISQMLFQKLSGNIPDTQETFQKLTERLEHSLETLRQLSRHSGNVPETRLDTGNTLWKPSVNSWTLWDFLKCLLDALSEILR